MVKVWRISCAVPMALLIGLCTSCAGSQDTVETEKISTCAVAIWLGAAIKQQKYNSHILPSAL